MKRIALRTLESVDGSPAIEYASVLREVLRRPLDPQHGVGIQEMRESLKVLDAIESADGTLELEDADYQHLVSKLTNMPWNLVDRRIVELIDDVTNA